MADSIMVGVNVRRDDTGSQGDPGEIQGSLETFHSFRN
jgi:hypothetical protein